MKRLTIIVEADDGTFATTATGRDAWALIELERAGNRGCTPIDNPAPRWSSYVFNLRHGLGLNIETITERHKGPFPGTHARYVLRTPVQIHPANDNGGK